jgi:hypothetical protein
VQRHELLRTTFRPSATSVSQVILDSYVPDVPVIDALTDANAALREEEWQDLDKRPPFRAEVTRVTDDNHILRLRVHRILADGYSMRLLLSEIGGFIARDLGLNDFPRNDSDLQYADYAIWERQWLTDDALARRIDHFRGQFALGELPAALPTDHPRSHHYIRHGRQFAFEFPPAGADAARALAIREQASLYVVLLAAFAATIGSCANQRAVVIGAPVSRRSDPAMQLIIGPFMNTVPLRVDLHAGADLPALVRYVKTKVLGALSNQDAPWHYVRAALVAQYGPSALGIGEVAFLMDDPTLEEFSVGGFALSRVPPERIVPRRDLTVAMTARGGQITGTVTYDGALFESRSIERIVTDFIAVLTLSHAGCA